MMRGFGLKIKMSILILAFALTASFFATGKQLEDPTAPLEIGIVPIFNAGTILPVFKPLELYLEQQLKRPVLLVTASDHQTFVRRTQNGDYPIVITSAHYARLAQTEAGYIPLLRTQKKLAGSLIVLKDSRITKPAHLRGKIIAFPNFISMSSFLGRSFLKTQHLSPGKDIQVRYFNSLSSSLYAVNSGEAEAAIASPMALHFLPEEISHKFKIIATTKSAPNAIILRHRRISKALSTQITRSIISFSKTAEGKKFNASLGFLNFFSIKPAEMKSLDHFIPELKILIEQ